MRHIRHQAKPGTMEYLCEEYVKNNFIDPEISENLGVKRGLRNADGTGVLTGLTNVCDVQGYELVEGKRVAVDGKLIYRGINVEELVEAGIAENRFMFEEVIWLLLFGTIPTPTELAGFRKILETHRSLPKNFIEDMIIKAPSPNLMNKLARSVLALYSYDENPEDNSLEKILEQSISLIASLPSVMVNAFQVKRRVYDGASMFFHQPIEGLSIAEHVLSASRADQKYTIEEARLLDLCLVLHADHGGGNNSTFACRVLSSSGTDTYAAVSAAIGSLKGPKHGGANIKVMEMLEYIMQGVTDHTDQTEIKEFLRNMIRKQEGDGSGLIYGMGHAVYTISDPRAVILRKHARALAIEKGFQKEFEILCSVEVLGPVVFAEEKGSKDVCANVDLFSGLIYRMLGLADDLFTPIFAISRIPGWCAHRTEEVIFANRIIRPAYKYLGVKQKYVPLEERE